MVDGDTLEVAPDDGGTIELRLSGVNAPESNECHYRESTTFLTDAAEGLEVSYLLSGRDQFGRWLAQVWVDGSNLNRELVARGHAIATTPDDGEPSYLSSEADAARAGLGMWSDGACGDSDPPPDVEIADVEPNPPGPDEADLGGEVVVISNLGETAVDLAGWSIRDESSRHRFRFPVDTSIAPGGRIEVKSSDSGWSPGGSPVWNNDGDLVILSEPSGRIVDHVRY